MGIVMLGSCIVTANNSGNTADTSVDDVVIQGVVGSSERSAQVVFDGYG